MKKIILIIILSGIVLTGCSIGKKDVLKEFSKKIDDSKSYYIEAKMDIINNEDTYTYDVNVSYKENDNYLVELNNISNNHKQIILRNTSGVYVITPSLNKSFKFQSDWPYNNSQAYLLSSIKEDLNNDDKRVIEEKEDGYVMTSNVNYPNNNKLVKQLITLDKNFNIKESQVLDNNNNAEIKVKFTKVDLNAKFDDDKFKIDNFVTEDNSEEQNTNEKQNETKETASIEDVIYPMYLPTNTHLKAQEKVEKEDGQRLILTFDGENPFILIEETVSKSIEHEIIPTFGEITHLSDTIGVVSENSVNWFSGDLEYLVVSDKMDKRELLSIARSISVLPVSK